MKLTDYAIRHRITVYVFVLVLILFGGSAYITLPREAAPDITVPFIVVSTLYIGAPHRMLRIWSRAGSKKNCRAWRM